MAQYSKQQYACAKWLRYCLSIGWNRSDLEELERIFWQYHPSVKP